MRLFISAPQGGRLPAPPIPIARAAPWLKSIARPFAEGPRSLMRTVTERPLREFVTRTRVPKESVRCAAVMAPGLTSPSQMVAHSRSDNRHSFRDAPRPQPTSIPPVRVKRSPANPGFIFIWCSCRKGADRSRRESASISTAPTLGGLRHLINQQKLIAATATNHAANFVRRVSTG